MPRPLAAWPGARFPVSSVSPVSPPRVCSAVLDGATLVPVLEPGPGSPKYASVPTASYLPEQPFPLLSPLSLLCCCSLSLRVGRRPLVPLLLVHVGRGSRCMPSYPLLDVSARSFSASASCRLLFHSRAANAARVVCLEASFVGASCFDHPRQPLTRLNSPFVVLHPPSTHRQPHRRATTSEDCCNRFAVEPGLRLAKKRA